MEASAFLGIEGQVIPRGQAMLGRNFDAPGLIGGRTVKFLVDEISKTPNGLADEESGGHRIEEE